MNARTFISFGDHKTEKFKLKKVERSRVTIDHEMGFITKDAPFLSTDLILIGLGELLLKPVHSPKSTPAGPWGELVVTRVEPRIMTQSGVRNQGL